MPSLKSFFVLSALFCISMSSAAGAASASDSSRTPADSLQASAAADSLRRQLLPETLSPGEHLLWGEHGLMRTEGGFPLTEESREREMGLRRGMLTAHQIGGFTTLALMIATVTLGQMTLDGHPRLGDYHGTLANVTIFSYAVTGSLALLTPPPLVRRNEWSTVSIHKGLAWIHVTGMILTPLLADGVAEHEHGDRTSPKVINRDKARIHQISGYITTAAFGAAMLVVTF